MKAHTGKERCVFITGNAKLIFFKNLFSLITLYKLVLMGTTVIKVT